MKSEKIIFKNSFLRVLAQGDFISLAKKELKKQTDILEKYIAKNPSFQKSLKAKPIDRDAPSLIQEMQKASQIFDIGPMASVAGSIAQRVAQKIDKKKSPFSVVDNGGDIFINHLEKKILVGVFSGSNFKNLALEILPSDCPLAICSSSGLMGHSLSLGRANLSCVFSRSASVADAGATFLANLIKKEADLERALSEIDKREQVRGAIAIKGEKIAFIGRVPRFVPHQDQGMERKISGFFLNQATFSL